MSIAFLLEMLARYTYLLIVDPNYAHREAVRQEIDDMLKAGIIEPSTSEWSSRIVLVPKRQISSFMCGLS